MTATSVSPPARPYRRVGEVLVWIWEATREWTTTVWLCDPCAGARRADRWSMSKRRLAPPRRGTSSVMLPDGTLFCPADLHDRIRLTCLDCDANTDLGHG